MILDTPGCLRVCRPWVHSGTWYILEQGTISLLNSGHVCCWDYRACMQHAALNTRVKTSLRVPHGIFVSLYILIIAFQRWPRRTHPQNTFCAISVLSISLPFCLYLWHARSSLSHCGFLLVHFSIANQVLIVLIFVLFLSPLSRFSSLQTSRWPPTLLGPHTVFSARLLRAGHTVSTEQVPRILSTMSLTPQSMPSPTSPDPYPYKSHHHHHPAYEYPSPAPSDGNNFQPVIYGLGLFDCPMPLTDAERHVSMSPLSSSHAVSSWSSSALQPHATNSQALPSGPGFSSEYDPYSHYNIVGNQGQDHYSSHSTLPASPVPSLEDSHSSIASTPYYSGTMHHGFTPRVKIEEGWSHDPVDHSLMPPMSLPTSLPQMDPAMSSSRAFDPNYYQQPHLNWSKFDHRDDVAAMTPPRVTRIEGRDSALLRDRRSTSANVTRVRQPRKLTTKEDANFQCRVKGCGKLFGRSYNYKAHMETHDAARVYPFPCPVQDCTKKFVRKTDLQRHHQSVHMKQRNFKCDYCQRHFARKDTLRRHMEDGCSKRFDIGTVDFNNQSLYSVDSSEAKSSPHQQNNLSRYSPPTMHQYPPISQSMSTPYPSTSSGLLPYHSKDPRDAW